MNKIRFYQKRIRVSKANRANSKVKMMKEKVRVIHLKATKDLRKGNLTRKRKMTTIRVLEEVRMI